MLVFALVFWLMTHPEASHHHEQVDGWPPAG